MDFFLKRGFGNQFGAKENTTKMSISPNYRGIFPEEEAIPSWRSAMESFPNHTPRFDSKDDAVAFIKSHCMQGSNPEYPYLTHSITTLITWDQIERVLMVKVAEYNRRYPAVLPTEDMLMNNRFYKNDEMETENDNKNIDTSRIHTLPMPSGKLIYNYLLSRLNLSIHKIMNKYSTLNTLNYLYHHMRCGIYIMIRNNKLVVFAPFVNKDYRNTWGDVLKVESHDGSLDKYYDYKSRFYREENYLRDKFHWWANGNIICNEYDKTGGNSDSNATTQWWGDHFLFPLKDMISETCNNRTVPDCDLFINKRDYPHLKFHHYDTNCVDGEAVEPYGFIYDRDDRDPAQDIPLARHAYKSYAPILSFYTSSRFADIPFPTSEDWESATGGVFPGSFQYEVDETGELLVNSPRDLYTIDNLKKFERPWSDKVNTAFFRGSATGGGVTTDTNQRLHAAVLCHEWEKDQTNQDSSSVPYLDAKIIAWNLRDKKIASTKMTFVNKHNFPFGSDNLRKNFVEIYKQSSYKYLLYIEGHCAACRYGFMMQLGSVILKVDSLCVADQMWYFPLLRPYYDHVPVKSDLSDLKEKIEWCRNNDAICHQIASNAQQLYTKFISRDGILDYMQSIFVEIGRRYTRPASWMDSIPQAMPPPVSTISNNTRKCADDGLCRMCALRKHQEDELKLAPLTSNANAVGKKRTAEEQELIDRKKAKKLLGIALEREKIKLKNENKI